MAKHDLILASASPRRRELLAAVGLVPQVIPSNVDEELSGNPDDPAIAAEQLAREKALAVATARPEAVVVAADTMVILDGVVLGKPGDADEARRMLGALRDREHQVITGVAVVHGDEARVAHAATRVHMRPYGQREIAAYIERGEPFDKAGSYAIQDPEFRPVATWRGCYCNVVGLPLALTLDLIADISSGLAPANPEFPQQCDQCPHRRSTAPHHP